MSSRAQMCVRMQRDAHTYDLIIVGGGITGCGVAYEAAARGAHVLLLEQGDFASGTSSRSTKLIHGGLRYLKQLDLRLVREGVRERQQLARTAAHLVHPTPFLYPVYRSDTESLLALRLGLSVYDWFAGRRNLLRHRIMNGPGMLEEEPLLRREGLQGGARYVDCLTDDARLTIEVAKAAGKQGAVLVNYMAVERFLYTADAQICGVVAADRMLGGATTSLYGSVVLNAAGPWVDQVRRLDDPDAPTALRMTKGVHVTVARARLPLAHPVVMHGPDGRMMFAVPRGEFTYLGTTDTDYAGEPGAVDADQADIDYILDAANKAFPSAILTRGDVISSWAGLRTLAAAGTEVRPSQISRDYRLLKSQSGLVSVVGGKLTAFQAMARSILRTILPERSQGEVDLILTGTVGIPAPHEAGAIAEAAGLTVDEVQELASRYGGDLFHVLRYRDPAGPTGRAALLVAEAIHAIEREFAVTLSDVLVRRASQLLFSQDHGVEAVPAIAAAMAAKLGWDGEETERQVAAYLREVEAMSAWNR